MRKQFLIASNLMIVFLYCSVICYAGQVNFLKVRGKTIKIGDTADNIFQTIKPSDSKKKNIEPDPNNPRSLLVTHFCEVEGKSFSLTFVRTTDPGPYRLIRITTSSPQKATPAPKPRTITDFESSAFFKKQVLVSKDAWDLRTGGRNNYYAFKDSENPYSSFSVEMTTKGQDVVEIGISWNGKSTDQPAKITPKKMEHLTDLALFWGIGKQAKQIIDYAKSQQSKRYRGGSSQAPRKTLGQITIHCGTTGETLWIGWK
jgi:hypothetical protein